MVPRFIPKKAATTAIGNPPTPLNKLMRDYLRVF